MNLINRILKIKNSTKTSFFTMQKPKVDCLNNIRRNFMLKKG